MKKLMAIPMLSLLVLSCQNNDSSDSGSKPAAEKTNAKTDSSAPAGFTQQKFDSSSLNPDAICSIKPTEFTGLYKTAKSIPIDSTEKLILVEELKKMGFANIGWGRGNFSEGPRLVSITMSNKECTLRVDKLYYSTDTLGYFRVTERIIRN